MKVLDLECRNRHVFEGWFASEADFLRQCGACLVECPVCGDGSISKRLSAPRLNLGSVRGEASPALEPARPEGVDPSLQVVWMEVTRRILASTADVGENFAEEARKIHYGEAEQRGIRGQASRAEAESLIEEGIAVMPLSLPVALKGQLQ